MNTSQILKQVREHLPTGPAFAATVFVPTVLMTAYFGLAALVLPSGVNKVFSTRSFGYAVPLAILMGIAYLIALPQRRARPAATISLERPSIPGDLVLLVLPLTPVFQYILNNATILSLLDSVEILAFFTLLSFLLVFGVPFLLRRTGAGGPSAFLGCAFAFVLTNMAAFSQTFSWLEWGSLRIQLPALLIPWFLIWVAYRLRFQRTLHVFLVLYFVSNSVLQVTPRQSDDEPVSSATSGKDLVTLIGSRRPSVNPSIYLLVYDAYVPSSILLPHGIDNRAQERYLGDLGFTLYPHTYSVGAISLTSMSRVLNASWTARDAHRLAVAGEGTVVRLLHGFGYETFGIFPSDFFFRGVVPAYDTSFPPHGSSAALLVRAVLEGEFRFDIDIDISREQYLQEKEAILSTSPRRPRFLYSHSDLPRHSQNSGVCRPNEVELYQERLTQANAEMAHDIENVLEADPGAIIIIAGDHGPYLTKNCAGTSEKHAYDISEINRQDILDRFGTFLAIRWPSSDFGDYDQITVLQDVFPAVLAYMFQDPGLLAARIEPVSREKYSISGAYIDNGVIVGGADDGEPLFVDDTPR